MVYGPVRVIVVGAYLVGAVPLVSGLAHTFNILVGVVSLLTIAHAHAIDVLRLSLADNGTHRL